MYKTKENKSGISLIVLVITIIVVVIIAAAVILTLTNNNPISEARKATFLSDVEAFKSELDMYNTTQYATTMGNYDVGTLNASVAAGNIYTVIPSLQGKTKYLNEFEVISGTLYYTGETEEEITWATTSGGIASAKAKPEVTLSTSNTIPVKAGGSVVYTLGMNATIPITIANLTGNVKVLNNAGTELATQPTINIGAVSGTTADKVRSATVTINTAGMADGVYKIKLLAEAVQTAGSKSLEVLSIATFEVDSTAPSMPTITINSTTWTNGNITATLTKSNATDTLEYSTNGTTWNAYTVPVTITSNLTVYARETDIANNVSNQATQIITIIDKTAPTVSFGTNGGSIPGTTASTTVTASDTSGSGINASTLQYVWDTQNSTTPVSGWATFTNIGTLTKTGTTGTTHYLWIKTTDNAGNTFTTKSNVFTLVGTTIYNFAYTGNYQTFTAPVTGRYKLEVWGASGGDGYDTALGGKGGYTYGEINLTQGQILYLYIGGKGVKAGPIGSAGSAGGWNGGGKGGDDFSSPQGAGGGGGGATDIRTTLGSWDNLTSLQSRIIVAGAGGGASTLSKDAQNYGGGHGGGLSGTQGMSYGTADHGGYGGTQSSGGAGAVDTTYGSGLSGSLGMGGNGALGQYGAGCGAGAGYYGGGGGAAGFEGGGGGGSGYIGSLASSQTIAGNTTMPNPSGGTMTGNTGNGYARITLL